MSPWVATRLGVGPLWFDGRIGTAYVRGFLPLMVVAASLVALAVAKRRLGLAVIAVVYLGLALLANLYDVENQAYNLGWSTSFATTVLPNLLLGLRPHRRNRPGVDSPPAAPPATARPVVSRISRRRAGAPPAWRPRSTLLAQAGR